MAAGAGGAADKGAHREVQAESRRDRPNDPIPVKVKPSNQSTRTEPGAVPDNDITRNNNRTPMRLISYAHALVPSTFLPTAP